jgi:hypothetical protein
MDDPVDDQALTSEKKESNSDQLFHFGLPAPKANPTQPTFRFKLPSTEYTADNFQRGISFFEGLARYETLRPYAPIRDPFHPQTNTEYKHENLPRTPIEPEIEAKINSSLSIYHIKMQEDLVNAKLSIQKLENLLDQKECDMAQLETRIKNSEKIVEKARLDTLYFEQKLNIMEKECRGHLRNMDVRVEEEHKSRMWEEEHTNRVINTVVSDAEDRNDRIDNRLKLMEEAIEQLKKECFINPK